MIKIGDQAPNIEIRTDEGTPIALADLAGRPICLLLMGAAFTPTVERLLAVVTANIDHFLSLNISPIAVFVERVDHLAEHREINDVPFLLASDDAGALHDAFRGDDGTLAAVWIIDKAGVVVDVLPMLPPTELVAMTLDRIEKSQTRDRPRQQGL